MNDALQDAKAPYHLVRSQPYPWAAILLVMGFALAISFLVAGYSFVVLWPIPVWLAVGAWLRASHEMGEGVGVFADEVHFGGHVVKRAEVDLMFATDGRLWVIGRDGMLMGWCDARKAFANDAMALLALGGVRIGVRLNEGLHPRCVLEATPAGLAIRGRVQWAWAEIASIELLPFGFFVRLTKGGSRSFNDVRTRFMTSQMDRTVMRAFVERANQLREAADGRPEVMARVSAALDAEGPFREASVATDDLWLVVESNHAPAELRIRAARALAKQPSIEPERFRIASEWCAEASVSEELEQLATTYKAAR